MSEEQKDNVSEKEKDKSEKLIYVLTGLLVVVIFGAIAVLYFNPSTDEKVYKPEKIQIAKETKGTIENEKRINNTNNNLDKGNEIANKETDEEKNKPNIVEKRQTVDVNTTVSNKNIATTETDNNLTVNNTVKENENISKELSEKLAENKEDNKSVPTKDSKSRDLEPKNMNNNLSKSSQNSKLNKESDKSNLTVQKDVAKKVSKETEKKDKKVNIPKLEKKAIEKEHIQRKYYYIQVGALASMEKARKEKERFEKRGFKNIVIIKEKGLYKLLIGRFKSLKEAMEYKRKHNLKEGWIRILKSPVN